MKHIKSSINVRYSIEVKDGDLWEVMYNFTLLQDSIDELEILKKTLPKKEFRLTRSEWTVIG